MPKRRHCPSIDAIQIQPICCHSKATTLRLPVTLGRQNLALLWWQACSSTCQAWIPTRRRVCRQHCRALRQRVAALSRSLVQISCRNEQDKAAVHITAKHCSLVHWKGRKALQHGTTCKLIIGENPQHHWMAFSIVGISDKQQGSWQAVQQPCLAAKRRIWLESSSSSSSSSCTNGSNGNGSFVQEGESMQQEEKEDDNKSQNQSRNPDAVICDTQQQTTKRFYAARTKILFRSQDKETRGINPQKPMPNSDQSKRQSHGKGNGDVESYACLQKLSMGKRLGQRHEYDTVDRMFKKNRTTTAVMQDDDSSLAASNDEEMLTIPCQVLRRDCNPSALPRKVTPDEKRYKALRQTNKQSSMEFSSAKFSSGTRNMPLTQAPYEVPSFPDQIKPSTTINTPSRDSPSPPQVASYPSNQRLQSTQFLDLPGMCLSEQASGSSAAAEMSTWKNVNLLGRRQTISRPCRDLCLADWRNIQQSTRLDSLLRATSDLVIAMNQGRHDDSQNLVLPDLMGDDATMKWEE